MKIPFSKKSEEKKPAVKEKKIKTVKSSAKSSNEVMLSAWKNILRPVVSEKNTMLNALNQYVFEVAPSANRIEIKKGIEAMYNVHAERVNVIPVKSKSVKYGKTRGWTKIGKKAVITLRKGERIEVSKGV